MNIKNFVILFIIIFSGAVFAESGKDFFDRFCTACHSPAMAPMFGSPAAHDISAWNNRKEDAFNRAIEVDPSLKSVVGTQKEEISLKELVKSAINGTDKGMPPRGTCNDCTEEDLKSVIKFMSSSE